MRKAKIKCRWNRRNNIMKIQNRQEKVWRIGGGSTAQKEENASETFWFPLKPFLNRTVLESLSIKNALKRTEREKKPRGKNREKPQPAITTSQQQGETTAVHPELFYTHPSMPSEHTHNIYQSRSSRLLFIHRSNHLVTVDQFGYCSFLLAALTSFPS